MSSGVSLLRFKYPAMHKKCKQILMLKTYIYFFLNYIFKQNTMFYIKYKGVSTKNFLKLSGFWLLSGCGGGEVGLGESIQKGNFLTKIFFADNVK